MLNFDGGDGAWLGCNLDLFPDWSVVTQEIFLEARREA